MSFQKAKGILESPLNLYVTRDPTRGGTVLDRNAMPETIVYSTVYALAKARERCLPFI